MTTTTPTVAGNRPATMLEEAWELFDAGHHLAAVLLARAAVEAHLRGLMRAVSHTLPGHPSRTAHDVRRGLVKAGVIDADREAWLRDKMRMADRAAHGVPFDRGQLAAFIQTAATVLDEVGQPAETSDCPPFTRWGMR